jgi:hypothetical protein
MRAPTQVGRIEGGIVLDRGPAQSADDLFSSSGFLIDSNLDSLPDDIRARIVLEDEPDADMWCALFDLAARLGLETSGFSPPLIVDEPAPEHVPIIVRRGRSIRPHLVATGWRGRPAVILEGADAIRDLTLRGHAAEENGVRREARGRLADLARLFESDGLLVDADGNEIPDGTRLCVMVPEDLPRAVGVALFHFITRLGVESSGIDLPIATASSHPRTGTIPLRLRLQDGYLARMSIVDHPTRPSLELFGDRSDVAALLDRLAVTWPIPPCTGCHTESSEIQDWLRRSQAAWTPEGRTAALIADLRSALPLPSNSAIRLLSANEEERDAQARAVRSITGDATTFLEPGAAQAIFTHDWSARWEVDRVLDVLQEDVMPRLDRRLPLTLTITVSEPAHIRRRLTERIGRILSEARFSRDRYEIQVLDAYKAGLCWLREVVIPEWKQGPEIQHITLRFRPLEVGDADNALDLRIRWLQELFPADEILAAEFDLPLDRIDLAEHDGPALYVASAFGEDDTLIARNEFTPIWYRRPYHSLFPNDGSVHLVSGGIQAQQTGIEVVERVPTDAERFWDYLQDEVLPNLQDMILDATDGEPKAEDQPFFDQLFIELTISETDEPYGIREEMNSAAEALHEDIYFNVLDFVETLGKNRTGERLSAPGGIVPIVHVRPGTAPHARIQLRGRARSVAQIESPGGTTPLGEIHATPPPRPVVSSVSLLRDEAQLQLRWPTLAPLLQRRLLALSELIPGNPHYPALVVSSDDGFQVTMGWPPAAPLPATAPAPGPVSESLFLNQERLAAQIERLSVRREVHVEWEFDRSYQGRPIPAIEVTAPMSASIWSRRKLSIFKPTFLIMARHHANEVASTTAAIRLVELLTGDNEWHRLLSRVNIAILPFENPDGAALHDWLQREHPTWKHHPARYNAVGYEFAEDSFNPDTPFGESRVRDRLWHRWLPDIIVDNHGVPSHEWAQTFAGFGSPPRFNVSYWQVQAMIYGILYHLDSEKYPEHRLAAYAIRNAVAHAVSSEIEMLQWNRSYRERYTTWGTRWVPERFPANTHREMIFYFGAYSGDNTRSRRSPAARFPSVTVASWVTEVPDETAHGEHLRLTAKAHLIANRATIDLLAASATPPERRILESVNGTRIMLSRRRPIVIGP